MTDWKPGQKLEGPSGERGIYAPYLRVWLSADEGANAGFRPVDDWSDPVAEARERVWAAVQRVRQVNVGPGDYIPDVDRLLRDPEVRAAFRVLLDAEEDK